MQEIKLLIFDVDLTITGFDSTNLYAAAKEFFSQLWGIQDKPSIALASNQGGVGLRYWMESDEFGDPSKYPTEEVVRQRMHTISESVRRLSGVDEVDVRLAFMYESKNGNWSPMKKNNKEWQRSSRKPHPGMLFAAMEKAGVLSEHTLMVGDGEEDSNAANRAGCEFMSTSNFFFSDDGFDPADLFRKAGDIPF